MTAYKVSEIKAMTSEELISALVNTSVRIAHQNGRPTKIQLQDEKRIVAELSTRFNLDEEALTEKLSK